VYSAWFQAAAGYRSSNAADVLTAQEARAFLMRFGLPAPTLAHVWRTVGARGGMNYQQFVMACRLIALVQSGTSSNMTQEAGYAAMFSPQQAVPEFNIPDPDPSEVEQLHY
jgi:hypothetical protein